MGSFNITGIAINQGGLSASLIVPVMLASGVGWQYGWQIPSSASVGLVGIPRATIDGISVPTGMPVWSGAITPGTATNPHVISGYKIREPSIPAHVTLQSCWICGVGSLGVVQNSGVGCVIQDCEISRDPAVDTNSQIYGFKFGFIAYGSANPVTILRTYVHDLGEGFRIGAGGLVRNCWVDHIVSYTGTPNSHNNAVVMQDDNPGIPMVYDANYFLCDAVDLTADILIQSNSSAISGGQFTGNLWGPSMGNNTDIAWDDRVGGINNMVFTNNRFVPRADGKYVETNNHGGTTTWRSPGNTFSDNYVNDPTKPNNQGAAVAAP